MAKGTKKVFVLNSDNPRDKKILDVLNEQYNYAEFVRNVLYEYINNNNLHHGNSKAIGESQDNHNIGTILPHNEDIKATIVPQNDNDFLIDLSDVSDTDANISTSVPEDPNKNALDFLKNSF